MFTSKVAVERACLPPALALIGKGAARAHSETAEMSLDHVFSLVHRTLMRSLSFVRTATSRLVDDMHLPKVGGTDCDLL